jgi:hypothetical protein
MNSLAYQMQGNKDKSIKYLWLARLLQAESAS